MDKQIEAGVKALHDHWKNGALNKRENASCVIGYPNGEFFRVSSQACHGGLGYQNEGSSFVISGIQPLKCLVKPDLQERWLNFLFSNSVWSSAFLVKDSAWCVDNKCVVADSNCRADLMVAGLVATRRMWEYTDILTKTLDFIDAGADPMFAYWLSHCVYLNNGSCKWQPQNSEHRNIRASEMSANVLLNFLSGKPETKKASYSKDCNYNGYTTKMWGHSSSRAVYNSLTTHKFKLVESGYVNPFAKSVLKDKSFEFSYKELLRDIKTIQANIYQEIGYECINISLFASL